MNAVIANQLIAMDPREARKLKWELGRQEHGEHMDLDPLLELYAEMLDAQNYVDALIGTHPGAFHPESYEASRLRQIKTAMTLGLKYAREIHANHPDRVFPSQVLGAPS